MNFLDLKNYILLYSLAFFIFLGSCKQKHPDEEPTFSITFFPKEHIKKFHYCFNISGLNGNLYLPQQCVDSATTLNIPCNILTDTSIFVFKYDTTHSDTVALSYNYNTNAIHLDAESYFYTLSKIKLDHCTFDSVKTICEDGKNPPCDDNGIQSINIYL